MELSASELLGAFQLGIISLAEVREKLGFKALATEEEK